MLFGGARRSVQNRAGTTEKRLCGVDLVFMIEEGKEVGSSVGGFGTAQHEEAAGLKGIMKNRQNFPMQSGPEINEDVAAANQVHVGERRVREHVLPGEDAHIPNDFVDLVIAVVLDKKPAEPFRGNVDLGVLRVNARPGLVQGSLADGGGDNVH